MQRLVDAQHQWGCIQVSGTTTFMRKQATRDGLLLAGSAPGYAEAAGWLSIDSSDLEYPDSCRVFVSEKGPIGVLSDGISKMLRIPSGARIPVQVQIFTSNLAESIRVDAWIWAGNESPEWRYSMNSRPPVTVQERASELHAQSSAIVRKSLGSWEQHATEMHTGMINGVHYLELIEPIKELKRKGNLKEALELCYQAIEATENEALAKKNQGEDYYLPPAYTIQAAIIHRKLKQYDEEIAVLERYHRATPQKHWEVSKPYERLAKILEKQKKV